ncbi:MAG: FHA domain-containing protein [Nitrospirae bacterium]|nr:FHA domain-containing protein [Nitrospirota bacterium]
MALVKICPTCGEKNDLSEMMCSRCLGDISGINPRPESEGQADCDARDGGGAQAGRVAEEAQAEKLPTEEAPPTVEALESPTTGKVDDEKAAEKPEVSIKTGGRPTEKDSRIIILRTTDGESITVHHGDVVGRKATGESILVRFSTVSRRHVRFTFESGRWFVEDLRSTNETYVDDMRMLPGEKVEVKTNVKISLSSSCPLVIEVPSG